MITNNSIDNQKVSSRITSLFPLHCGPFIKKNRYKPQRMAFCFKILFLTNLSVEKKHYLSIYLSTQYLSIYLFKLTMFCGIPWFFRYTNPTVVKALQSSSAISWRTLESTWSAGTDKEYGAKSITGMTVIVRMACELGVNKI